MLWLDWYSGHNNQGVGMGIKCLKCGETAAGNSIVHVKHPNGKHKGYICKICIKQRIRYKKWRPTGQSLHGFVRHVDENTARSLCPICGEDFVRTAPNKKYCSRECYWIKCQEVKNARRQWRNQKKHAMSKL